MNRKDKIFLFIIAAAFIAIGGGVVYTQTRGLRNNNPGNIRRSGDVWQGLLPQQTDEDFFQFVSPEYGIRALARVLLNYQQKYGLNTVRGIISRWAPEGENDTASYIAHVARQLGVTPDTPISVADALPVLIPAIILHENGLNPYSSSTILKGIQLAYA